MSEYTRYGFAQSGNAYTPALLLALAALQGWQRPYDVMPGHPLPAKGA